MSPNRPVRRSNQLPIIDPEPTSSTDYSDIGRIMPKAPENAKPDDEPIRKIYFSTLTGHLACATRTKKKLDKSLRLVKSVLSSQTASSPKRASVRKPDGRSTEGTGKQPENATGDKGKAKPGTNPNARPTAETEPKQGVRVNPRARGEQSPPSFPSVRRWFPDGLRQVGRIPGPARYARLWPLYGHRPRKCSIAKGIEVLSKCKRPLRLNQPHVQNAEACGNHGRMGPPGTQGRQSPLGGGG